MPSAAFGPVSAPAMAMVVVAGHVAVAVALALTGVPPAATGTSLPSTSICTCSLIVEAPPAAADPDADALPEAAADPLAAGAALLDVRVRGLGSTGCQRQGGNGHQDEGGSHRTSMHWPPPKILFTGRTYPAVPTTPTRGEPIPRMAQSACNGVRLVTKMRLAGSHAAQVGHRSRMSRSHPQR